MTHVVLRHAPETKVQVVHAGKSYTVRFERGAAFVPRPMALELIKQGLVVEGELSDPAPKFARNADGSHGKAISLFDRWVTEVQT